MRILAFVCALALLPVLFGCGEVNHEVNTGGDGSLDGLVITPAPQSLGISTTRDFDLDWLVGSEPPQQFEVSLEAINPDGTHIGVGSEVVTESFGHYNLDPSWVLDGQQFYLLTVTAPGEEVRAIYLTGGFRSAPDAGKPVPAAGQVKHTVITRPPA